MTQDLYETYARPVYRFLLKLTGDENRAEELLQETFYRALLSIDRFEGRGSLYTWLCAIGKNAWLKERKRLSRYTDKPPEDESPSGFGASAEAEALQRLEAERARGVLLNLPEPYRDVFILHVLGGAKLIDIAHHYGKSESWARVTYFRAREMLRKELE